MRVGCQGLVSDAKCTRGSPSRRICPQPMSCMCGMCDTHAPTSCGLLCDTPRHAMRAVLRVCVLCSAGTFRVCICMLLWCDSLLPQGSLCPSRHPHHQPLHHMSTCSNFKFQISNLLCSAGTFEDWRPDASQFTAADKGASNGWPGESWIDTRSPNVRTIMAAVSE